MKNKIITIILLFFMIFTLNFNFNNTCIVNAFSHRADDVKVQFGLGANGVLERKTGENDFISIKNEGDDSKGILDASEEILDQYHVAISGIAATVSVTFLVFFLLNLVKLGQSSGNPQMRSQALMAIIWCGIACAATGGVGIFFGFFYDLKPLG